MFCSVPILQFARNAILHLECFHWNIRAYRCSLSFNHWTLYIHTVLFRKQNRDKKISFKIRKYIHLFKKKKQDKKRFFFSFSTKCAVHESIWCVRLPLNLVHIPLNLSQWSVPCTLFFYWIAIILTHSTALFHSLQSETHQISIKLDTISNYAHLRNLF